MKLNRRNSSVGAVLGVAIAVALGMHTNRLDAQSEASLTQASPVAMSTSGMALPDFRSIVRSNIDAIVKIEVEDRVPDAGQQQQNPFGNNDPLGQLFRGFPMPQQQQPRSGIGSGFIVESNGRILTNAHVVKGADEITVRLNDQRTFTAKVIGLDESTDIAVLQVEARGLPTVKVGDSDLAEVGEWVLAIGSPFQLDFSATQGIISATGRNLPGDRFVPFIQTDAAVNPGNSGGPLFNVRGEVIGINSQIFSRSGGYMGLSFAIPIKTAMNVADQLESKGFVDRGWLGVGIQSLSPAQARALELDRPTGAVVNQIERGSPADQAGIKPYDVILKFDGQAIKNSADLPPLVAQTAVGKDVTVDILRDGKRMQLDLEVGKLKEDRPLASNESPKSATLATLALAGLTESQKEQLGVENGVVITDLRPGPAAEAGLQRGDVVLEVNRKAVDSPADFSKQIEAQDEDKPTLLLVRRGAQALFLAVEGLN